MFHVITVLEFLVISEFQRCHAEMIFYVFAKERGIRKGEFVADLFDAEICLTQVVADVLQHLFCNPLVGGLARVLLADSSHQQSCDKRTDAFADYQNKLLEYRQSIGL